MAGRDVKILVTGGAGFIGSAFVRHAIRERKAGVVNLDKLTYAGNRDSLADIANAASYVFEHADILDRAALQKIFAVHEPDAVVHLAAESHVDRSIDDYEAFVQTNVVGTGRILDASLRYWRRLDPERAKRFRFLHVSTDEVYGDLGNTEVYAKESSPYAPSSPYAATKAASDHLVRAWSRTYGMPLLITNCSNNYGPYQFPEKLIPHMLLNALADKPLPVYGDGQQVRDWLYVDDHVAALWQVLRRGKIGETYNIAGRSEQRNLVVVQLLCELLERLVPRGGRRNRFDSLITFVADRPGHDVRYALDSSKIESELGWRPTETLETGLEKTVRWYLDNRSWWERVLNGSYRLERLGSVTRRN